MAIESKSGIVCSNAFGEVHQDNKYQELWNNSVTLENLPTDPGM